MNSVAIDGRSLRFLLALFPLLACQDPADDDSVPPTDDDTTLSSDDDDSAADTDPWPDGPWPDELVCAPEEESLGIPCDFTMEDQFGNPVHLYDFYGHPLALFSCMVGADGNIELCEEWFLSGQTLVGAHPDLWWINVLIPASQEVPESIRDAVASSFSTPSLPFFWDSEYQVDGWPDAGPRRGFLTVLSNMHHDGWEDDPYMTVDDLPARIEQLLEHDAETE